MKPGVELLSEEVGPGELVLKHATYQVRLRMWLSRGDPVRWSEPWGLLNDVRIEDDGATLLTDVRIDRVFLSSRCTTSIRTCCQHVAQTTWLHARKYASCTMNRG